ncbi:hypothetical protein FRC12_003863 [Ceratobasidium sp. 428]|nr:hypothetical protein FRC12_003863 [Ceratobasidium sp. 428]
MASVAAFIPPLKDGSVPLDAAVDFHLKHNAKHVFTVLYDVGSRSQTNITYEQLGHAVHCAAHILNPDATIPQGTNLGIFISADTITYITLVLGAIRAGLVPFPISPRTQVEGIAHLFSETHTSRVLVGGGLMIDQLYKQVNGLLKDRDFKLEQITIPGLGDLYPHLGQEPNTTSPAFEPFPTLKPTTGKSAIVILHSSGSTGLPRAVPYDQEGVFKNIINQPMIKTLGGPGVRTGLMAVPTFHATGVMIQCLKSLYQGYTQVLFAPRSDPVVPTPDLTLQALSDTDCETTLAWPAFLETWAEDQEAISRLKRLKTIVSYIVRWWATGRANWRSPRDKWCEHSDRVRRNGVRSG